jgi:hypothetical protein
MSKPVKITAELTAAEAMALAQFHKRIGWGEFRSNAVDDAEAYLMRDASEKVRAALAEQGYAPR